MSAEERWQAGLARGIIGGLLAVLLGVVALRDVLSAAAGGAWLGGVCAFGASYLTAAVQRGLIRPNWPQRAVCLVLLPPFGTIPALLAGWGFAAGFTFSGMAVYMFSHGLVAIRTGEASRLPPW